MKKIVPILLAVTLCLTLTSCGGPQGNATTQAEGEGNYNFSISVDAAPDELISQYAQKFKEELESRSNGAFQVSVYTNGTLGSDSEALQSCADGSLAFVLSTTAPQVSYMKGMAMFDLPFLFTNLPSLRSIFDNPEFMGTLNDIYEEAGYQLLGVADSGFRVLSCNKKVEKLADLSGIKIRVMNNSNHIAIWNALGASPTPMSFSEVYTALQQGTIDAQENPVETFTSSRFFEQQDYLIMTNHVPNLNCMMMSTVVYEGLPEEYQNIIKEAADASTQYTRELSDSYSETQLKLSQDNGVEVIDLGEETLVEMREACADVYTLIKDQIGEELYQQILAVAGLN